jgi:serine-type D-Ala-D-Ala carboxypeptidase/endopeptidase
MKRWTRLVIAVGVALAASPAAAQDAAGDWVGVIEVSPEIRLPLIVHIKRDDAGVLSGTMDSPTQGVRGLPLTEIASDAGTLDFAVLAIGGTYKATWDAEAKAWAGQWSQNGMTWPLRLIVPPPPQPLPADWPLPSNDDIAKLIADRNAPRAGQGIVVGVLGPGDRRVVAGGPAGGTPFDGDTLFEIGSITKVFTALILADMANKGEVSLDDPASKYLPAGHKMPARGGRQITLRDLSQHRSGLPRMPDNMPFADPADPFADYGEELMLAFLDRYQLPREIGSEWEYSNVGVGLLGYLLARAAGSDYETLVRQRIAGPLGMNDTAITLSADQTARFATGLDAYLRPAKPWNLAVLQGAGAIRSSVNDMLKFAAATLDPTSPIAPMVKTVLATRAPGSSPQTEQGLGWVLLHPEPAREILLHDGGTGGYRTVIAIEPAKRRAAIALANTSIEPAPADIALRVLTGSPVAPTPPVPPAPPPVAARTEISLPAAELDRFVGRFDFGTGVTFVFTRDGDRLLAQRQGLITGPVLQIYPETPLKFFWRIVNAEVTFVADADGKINAAQFKQDTYSAPGKRVEP